MFTSEYCIRLLLGGMDAHCGAKDRSLLRPSSVVTRAISRQRFFNVDHKMTSGRTESRIDQVALRSTSSASEGFMSSERQITPAYIR
jgi:hypothetical protein